MLSIRSTILRSSRQYARPSLIRIQAPHLKSSTVEKRGRQTFTTKEIQHSFGGNWWEGYQRSLVTYPYWTKIITASLIAAAGDILSQYYTTEPEHDAKDAENAACIVKKEKKMFDFERLAKFTFLTGVVMAPVLHQWYLFLARVAPGIGNKSIIKRLILDQFVFAPAFLPVFFTMLLAMENKVDMIPDKLRKDWWPTIQANWVVWFPAQLINFRFVPGSLQVLFANIIGLFWNAYISFVSHKELKLEDKHQTKQ